MGGGKRGGIVSFVLHFPIREEQLHPLCVPCPCAPVQNIRVRDRRTKLFISCVGLDRTARGQDLGVDLTAGRRAFKTVQEKISFVFIVSTVSTKCLPKKENGRGQKHSQLCLPALFNKGRAIATPRLHAPCTKHEGM